ncbi:MAG: GNAT family N-acetyltransferase [Sphingomonadaceae bacterium]|nr:GNAT family N-acetyltransferase [Sphingomonadaceae bacterium]
MFIRSERLFLRPGWPEESQELFALIRDEEIAWNLASARWPYKAGDAREFIVKLQETGLPNFFVTLPTQSGAKLIGCAGLARDRGETTLGYWIARDYWGHGYATEAVRAVLGTARALGYRRIVAGHLHDNPASGRVLAKAGFSPTGQTLCRYSPGRGAQAASVRFEIDLGAGGRGDAEEADVPSRMAA